MASDRAAGAAPSARPAAGRLRVWAFGVLPLLLILIFVALFLRFGPLGVFRSAFPPVEELTITGARLTPGVIELAVTNGGPSPVTVAQVLVDEAYWNYEIRPDRIIPRLGQATITIPYPWVEGETHEIVVLSETGIAFTHTIAVATESPRPDARYLLTFTLLGVYVGVIPVFLGMLWFPFLRRIGRRWINFFLSLTAGLLVFLGIDALAEALENAGRVPGAFQGVGLVGVGALVSILILIAVGRVARRGGAASPLVVAYLIAVGIGLHNLGEGLAIGAAYSLGQIALGTFLVLGFMLHNTTEGLGIVAPIARQGASLGTLAVLGLIAGGPTIPGAWLGGFTVSPVAATLFLAVGAGAIFQVVYEILKLMASEAGQEVATLINVAGFALGLLIMYATGIFVAV
jgi:zinc transporter ZupT